MKVTIICHMVTFLSVTTYKYVKGGQMTNNHDFHVAFLIFESMKFFTGYR